MARPPRPPLLSWSSIFTQMWPPKPPFTEEHVPDLHGKVRSNSPRGMQITQTELMKILRTRFISSQAPTQESARS